MAQKILSLVRNNQGLSESIVGLYLVKVARPRDCVCRVRDITVKSEK